VLGDARLALTDAPDESYDLIFVDAFIGAAIPIHLLTREAMAIYLRKLKPHGIVAMHVSNKNLELASVVCRHAEEMVRSRACTMAGRQADQARANGSEGRPVARSERTSERSGVGILPIRRARPETARMDRRLFQHRRLHAAHLRNDVDCPAIDPAGGCRSCRLAIVERS